MDIGSNLSYFNRRFVKEKCGQNFIKVRELLKSTKNTGACNDQAHFEIKFPSELKRKSKGSLRISIRGLDLASSRKATEA